METRDRSFLLSLGALVVALGTFITRSVTPQTTVVTPPVVTTAAPLPATATATQTVAPVVQTAAAMSTDPTPLSDAANAVVAVMNAQTERFKAEASASTERYKAEASRNKDDLDQARQAMEKWCDCIYKFVLLATAAILVVLLLPRITNLTFFGVLISLSPVQPPPLPKGAEVLGAADVTAPLLYLSHQVIRSWRRPRFVVRLEGEQAALAEVSEVTYYLHPAYGDTTRVVRSAPFTLDIHAIGEFLLYADAKLASGTIIRMERYLDV